MLGDATGLERQAIKLTRVIALSSAAILLLVALLTLIDVMMRWLFRSPIIGLPDLAQLLTIVFAAGSLPITLAARQQIVIRFLGEALPYRPAQTVETFGGLVTLLALAVLVWQMALFIGQSAAENQITPLLGWGLTGWWAAATVLFALCLPVQAIVVIAQFRRIRRRS